MSWDAVLLEKGARNDWLSRVGANSLLPTYTSQRGEDRILQTIFHLIGETNKWCVEFGATDGHAYSNSWYWINERGWASVQIEAARDIHLELRTRKQWSYDALSERYASHDRVICLNQMVMPEGEHSLDALLASTPVPREFDLLSIDVDSTDYAIWESLLNYQPRVVIVEHNKTIPIDVSWNSPLGSSLRALHDLGKRKGYELVAANDLNGIFVRKELAGVFEIRNSDPAELWPQWRDFGIHMRKLSDGTPHFMGSERVRWVRGVDGTMAGQLRAGKFRVFGPEITSANKALTSRLPVRISGIIRHLLYSIRV